MSFGEKFKNAAKKFSKTVDSGIAKGKITYGKMQQANEKFQLKQEEYRDKQDKKLDKKISFEMQKSSMNEKKLKLRELQRKNRGSSSFDLKGGFKL